MNVHSHYPPKKSIIILYTYVSNQIQHHHGNHRNGFQDLYVSGGPASVSGDSYFHDVRSQADAGSVAGSIESRRF